MSLQPHQNSLPEKAPDRTPTTNVLGRLFKRTGGWLQTHFRYWSLAWDEFQRTRGYRWMKTSGKFVKFLVLTGSGLGIYQIVSWLLPLLPKLAWLTITLGILVIIQECAIHFLGRYYGRRVDELNAEYVQHLKDYEKKRETKVFQYDMGQTQQLNRQLASAKRELSDITKERDSLKSQYEELTKHKLIFEIDQRHTVIRVEQTKSALRIFANIQLRFENKDIYPLYVKGVEISLRRYGIEGVRKASEIYTRFAVLRFSSNGTSLNKSELENMLVQERRVTPFYMIETMLAIEDEHIKDASDLDAVTYLMVTLRSSGSQPEFSAKLFLSWESALTSEGTSVLSVQGAPYISRV
jgi:hypothetical protein